MSFHAALWIVKYRLRLAQMYAVYLSSTEAEDAAARLMMLPMCFDVETMKVGKR